MKIPILSLIAIVALAPSSLPAAESSPPPWPVPVPGFVPPKPGEHPRMLFRAADIPGLRKKAETEDGKRIIAQLKVTLGGGDAMPTEFAQDPPVNYAREDLIKKHPVGTYTLSHSVGFGFLYTLTGDKKYADLARQCLDKMFAGQVDRDSRYNYLTPGTGFRLGFIYQSAALAYDLCYDAWPEDYRKSVVERCQTFVPKKVDKGGKPYDLEKLADGGGYPPSSNHFGGFILGPAMLAMAFKGDLGADDKRLAALLAESEAGLQKQVGHGFGDMGWFSEGTSCGRISANNGLIPMIASLKIAEGKDYNTPRPGARYTMLHLMHEIVSGGTNPQIPHRGDYGDNKLYGRYIISHMGDFSQGMGAVKPEEAQAMAWIWDTFVEAGGRKTYDAQYYPHLAAYAFVFWPSKTTDPDEVLPHVIVDTIHGYYVARNRWQDGQDAIVTVNLKRGPGGYKSGKVSRGTFVWGLGEKLTLGGVPGKETTHFRAGKDGSMELATDAGGALAVDYSGASGAPVLVVAAGLGKEPPSGKKSHVTQLTLGATPVSVLTLSEGEHPTPEVRGDSIVVGKQTIKLDGTKLVLSQFTPAS